VIICGQQILSEDGLLLRRSPPLSLNSLLNAAVAVPGYRSQMCEAVPV
jgi:hypothetical protein